MDVNNEMNTTVTTATPAEPEKAPEKTEAEKKKAFEEAEAKRKAEFDAKKAERDEEIQIEWEMNTMMTPEELAAKAKESLTIDIERITQRQMKDCVGAHIISASQQKEIIARHVFHPKKNMVNCFRFINRKAREYLEEYMKLTGDKPDGNGVIGIDIPDNLCYMWAEEYFSSTDIPEDHEDEEKFEPKTYRPSVASKTAKKTTPKKKDTPPPKEEPKTDAVQLTMI